MSLGQENIHKFEYVSKTGLLIKIELVKYRTIIYSSIVQIKCSAKIDADLYFCLYFTCGIGSYRYKANVSNHLSAFVLHFCKLLHSTGMKIKVKKKHTEK